MPGDDINVFERRPAADEQVPVLSMMSMFDGQPRNARDASISCLLVVAAHRHLQFANDGKDGGGSTALRDRNATVRAAGGRSLLLHSTAHTSIISMHAQRAPRSAGRIPYVYATHFRLIAADRSIDRLFDYDPHG